MCKWQNSPRWPTSDAAKPTRRTAAIFIGLAHLPKVLAATGVRPKDGGKSAGQRSVSARDFGALGDGTGRLASPEFVKQANAYYSRSGNLSAQEPRFRAQWDSQDFVALQLAIDYAARNQVRLVIPAGDYVLTKCLIIKLPGVRISGEGMFSTILRQHASNGWFPEVSDDSQVLVGGKVYASTDYGTEKHWSETAAFRVDDFQIEDLAVIGDMVGLPHVSQSGLQIQGQPHAWARNARVLRCYFSGHAECGLEPSYVDGLLIEGCVAEKNGWQFVGTDHAIRNAVIAKNTAREPAVGTSESAFLDLEDGGGSDFENIIVRENVHEATLSGFVKVHPGGTSNVRGLTIWRNVSKSAGAKTLGFYGQFWTGPDSELKYGNVSHVVISENKISGYRNDVFRIGASESGAGRTTHIVVSGNQIETSADSLNNTVVFNLPMLVEDCLIASNVIKASGRIQSLARISWQAASTRKAVCRDVNFTANSVEIGGGLNVLEVNQVDGLTVAENTVTCKEGVAAGGAFLGLLPGGDKRNISVRRNRVTLGNRNVLLAYYQRLEDTTIEENWISANSTVTAPRNRLFGLNRQVVNCRIRNNHLEAGARPILLVGDGVGAADPDLKCKRIVFEGNNVQHRWSGAAYEVRQCADFRFVGNNTLSLNGGSGVVTPAATNMGNLLLEGEVEVSDNIFNGLGSSGTAFGVALSFRDGRSSSAFINRNRISSGSALPLTDPILVAGNPRDVEIIGNEIHGLAAGPDHCGISVTGTTPGITAEVSGNRVYSRSLAAPVRTSGQVRLTENSNETIAQ